MSMTAAIIAGVGAAVKGISASSSKNARVEAEAIRHGTQAANNEYKQENVLNQAQVKSGDIAEAEQTQLMTIAKNEAQSIADASVASAATGATGNSQDQQIQQMERNADMRSAEAKALADKQLKQLQLSTEQALVGGQANSSMNTSTSPTELIGVLSGMSAYNMALSI